MIQFWLIDFAVASLQAMEIITLYLQFLCCFIFVTVTPKLSKVAFELLITVINEKKIKEKAVY